MQSAKMKIGNKHIRTACTTEMISDDATRLKIKTLSETLICDDYGVRNDLGRKTETVLLVMAYFVAVSANAAYVIYQMRQMSKRLVTVTDRFETRLRRSKLDCCTVHQSFCETVHSGSYKNGVVWKTSV